ncbi:acetylcholine receptor subunit alpha-like 2 protein [Lasius niger]|uniref:Acetylcholine receptor subunit alpha-like 2 protein n=1 Tax=Lasius niger TaxID=67767 RepID=A0A0J7KUP1_LASNI|nr:acetylcholine receptor subunit alpha-like 2 protein [Lasius niger]
MIFPLIILILSVGICYSNPDAKRLYDDLLSNYNRLIRPVSNNTDTVIVKLGLRLSQLIDLNLKDQILTTNVWLEHEWQDHKFQWDPLEYGGVTELYVPSEHIWLPDIVLYNNADGEYGVTTMTKAILHYTGKVLWTPPAIFKSSCEIDVRYFPFDQQTCFMKFGSWTYDGFQIDLKHINQDVGDQVKVGIDLREYYPSVEWDILGVPAERHKKYYPCCLEPYPDIFFNITLRRKTLFYTVNLIVPCVSISYLSVLAFYLPADSGEKIALCINILLSQTMFFLLISEIIPSTSLALPLLGKYLLFTMILVGLSVVITIIILNVHYRKPSTHKMAPWVRKIFIRRLPKLLLMRVPDDLLSDLAAHKIHGRGRSGKKKNKIDKNTEGGMEIHKQIQKEERERIDENKELENWSFYFMDLLEGTKEKMTTEEQKDKREEEDREEKEGGVPEEWNKDLIISPICKKGEKSDVKNYKEVILMDTAYKIYVNILNERLKKEMEKKLEEGQFGFRAGRCTIDAIYTLNYVIIMSNCQIQTSGWTRVKWA